MPTTSPPKIQAPPEPMGGVSGATAAGAASAPEGASIPLVVTCTAALFAGAALTFLLQPMVARMVLPLLGGSPEVWNTCVVVYQLLLLAGYAYAHLFMARGSLRRQVAVHAVVLAVPILVLPIALPQGARPPVDASPIPWLLGTLLAAIALPFFATSTTAPLIQRWFSNTRHRGAGDPYYLYAASNLGSLLALLAYPLVVEPSLALARQSCAWSIGYGIFAALTIGCGVLTARHARRPAPDVNAAALGAHPAAASGRDVAAWVFFAAVPSSLLLGVTSYLSTDVAAIPLLWVVPLAIYLGTFVLVFARRPPLPHSWMRRALPVALLALALLLLLRATRPAALLFPVHLITFFVAAMACHGELVRRRPPARELTRFYLWIAVGGAVGGLFNALIAPTIFTGVVEYPLALVLSCAAFATFGGEREGRAWIRIAIPAIALTAAVALAPAALRMAHLDLGVGHTFVYSAAIFCCYLLSGDARRFGLALGGLLLVGLALPGFGGDRTIFAARSFFGVHRVQEERVGGETYHVLLHGTTRHGLQCLTPGRRTEPLLYYHPQGPAGDLFRYVDAHPDMRRIAVIGLGSGALAAYGRAGQDWTFYEIDPLVERIARDPHCFTYLRDSAASWNIQLGDGRLSIARATNRRYDLIVIDAFGSDSIPVHLITREALRVYLSRLASGGLIAFHISNRYLDLEPVLGNLARDAGLCARGRFDNLMSKEAQRRGRVPSHWVVMSRTESGLRELSRTPGWTPLRETPGARVWTDDYSGLLGILRWN